MPKRWLKEDKKLKDGSKKSKPAFYDLIKPETQIKFNNDLKNGWSFDEISDNTRYVDLTKDNEGYTGYKGNNIWKKLYGYYCKESFEKCKDNKFLYKMTSSLHTSISTHLSKYYKNFETNSETTYPNDLLYLEIVGKHPERISNLMFGVNILLRAFNRYYPSISHLPVDTGNFMDDYKTKKLLNELSREIEFIKDRKFDDSLIFGMIINNE